jgi:hypothetical protein
MVERRSCSSPEPTPSNMPVLRQLPSFSTQRSRSLGEYSYVTAEEVEDSELFYPIREKNSEEEFVEVSLSLQEPKIKPVPIKASESLRPQQQFQFLEQ